MASQSATPVTPAQPAAGPHMNALKHGRRSAAVLLPGDDSAEFQQLREDWYALFQPRTRLEARCVEAMVEHEWCLERCRELRYGYHAKLRALVRGGPGTPAVHCERDPHRWHHSAMDCALEEGRLERLQDRERRKLAELKKLRRQNLLARLRQDEADAPLTDSGAPAEADVAAEAPAMIAHRASPSHEATSGENPERTADGSPAMPSSLPLPTACHSERSEESAVRPITNRPSAALAPSAPYPQPWSSAAQRGK